MDAPQKDDWLHDDDRGTHVLASDVRVWLKEDREGQRDFTEDWHKVLPDPRAVLELVTLHFLSVPVKTFATIIVDGGRAKVPVPKHDGNIVRPLDVAICRGVDLSGTLGDYMNRLKFQIEDY